MQQGSTCCSRSALLVKFDRASKAAFWSRMCSSPHMPAVSGSLDHILYPTRLPAADLPGQLLFMSNGWFDPSTASALRQHIRHKVLVMFQVQAAEQMQTEPCYLQAVVEAKDLEEQYTAKTLLEYAFNPRPWTLDISSCVTWQPALYGNLAIAALCLDWSSRVGTQSGGR